MLMTHKKSKEPIEVHPSQVESAKHNGWVEAKPKSKSTKKDEVKDDANGNG